MMRAAINPPPLISMNEEHSNPDDAKLSALLRQSRATPSLRPRFQENVWRRIEESDTPVGATRSWLDALASWALRPRFALAAAVVLILAGSLVGAREGHQTARNDAQNRYIAAVAPNSLR
jgi:hypothetical protein